MNARRIIETALAYAGAPPPPVSRQPSGEGDSERDRLLNTWRQHPEALADMESPEVTGGAEDGTGLVILTEPTSGSEIDRFTFGSREAADAAVEYVLSVINASPL